GVGVQAEDLAQVHGRGPEQFQAVGLGPGHRLLVRVNASRSERLQTHAGHEAAPRVALALNLELLVINVQSPRRILHQPAFALPLAEGVGGARVAVVGLGVAGQFLVEDQADNVVRAAIVESLLQGRVDDVVWWSDDVAEGADAAEVVTKRTEGSDFGHDTWSLENRATLFPAA